MILLVLLRVAIGWHFFSEGLDHHSQRSWSSEMFLRQAKGPLTPLYHSVIPDFHHFDDLIHGDQDEETGVVTEEGRPLRPGEVLANRWRDNVLDAWEAHRKEFSDFYNLTDQQKQEAVNVLALRKGQFEEWVGLIRPDIDVHVYDWRRIRASHDDRASKEVPFMKKRSGDKLAALKAEASRWASQAREFERGYQAELEGILTSDQLDRGDLPRPKTTLTRVDKVMTYGILTIGVCLIVGLLTRTAAVLGALFLLSVVASQPFWVPGTQPTFNQAVEMIALMVLSTTHVGRWAGLDFFLHSLLGRCCSKGQSHELDS